MKEVEVLIEIDLLAREVGRMKILYLSGATGADYQCDLCFHGLRSLLGENCVDVNKLEFMYQGWPHPPFHSLYALLPNIEVDRGDVEAKIKSRYFDAVVYGSIHRCNAHLQLVLDAYPRERIVFIDGEDDGNIHHMVGRGWYFKRELDSAHPDILPIQFGVPKEKIRPIDLSRKTRLMAHCDPRDRSTMVYYDSESRYYDQYSDAWFGYTMRKGGWDCMRHHEIIAAGCLPYFEDFDNCPTGTLHTFNRKDFANARMLHSKNLNGENNWITNEWEFTMNMVRDSLQTTEDLARLILDKVT